MEPIPELVDEKVEINNTEMSPIPPLSAPAGKRMRISIEKAYNELAIRLNKAKEEGDEFEESVVLRKK